MEEHSAPPGNCGPQANNFNHPYTPYDVQLQFMRTVYEILEKGEGQVGILESPTGTGKSLSLICATLSWLRAHKAGFYESALQTPPDQIEDEPPWVVAQLLAQKRASLVQAWEDREARLEAVRALERREEERAAAAQKNPKKRRIDGKRNSPGRRMGLSEEEEDEYLLDDIGDADSHGRPSATGGLSVEAQEVLAKLGLIPPLEAAEDQTETSILDDGVKIYFTSRTHSQLTQFISELRRPSFPASIPESLMPGSSGSSPVSREPVKLLPLSSRQKLCINPTVSSLSSLGAINDRCAELQQSKSSAKCPFIPSSRNVAETHRLRDAALATLPDIEDLHRLGVQHGICPYYASRTALDGAEIVALPYPLLLQKSAREALGIKLENSVVVIDEAHNIMDAIAGVHASSIKLSELRRAREMLGAYVRRFGRRLGSEKKVLVGRVGRVVEGLRAYLEEVMQFKETRGVVDTGSLLKSKGIDQINMFELIKYIQASKLAYKIESYVTHVDEESMATTSLSSGSRRPLGATTRQPRKASTPVLHTLVSYLISLTNLASEGRIFYEKLSTDDVQLSYLLLSPTHAFSSIASSARAVILAGGTMSPFSDYAIHLFPSHAPSKITTLSCGHVVPAENLFVWTLVRPRARDHASAAFDFTFGKRSEPGMIRDLGVALLNICGVVPDGVVVFFPSYGYLDDVTAAWQEHAPGQQSTWEKLVARKALFRETKGGSSEEILREYGNAILCPEPRADAKPPRGALLLSVVGGRLSEGINFSDRLGRCVVVVGLPYPNPSSPEWKAKSEYLESSMLSRLSGPDDADLGESEARARARAAARDFYENACLRAVNQSVGRVIRHKGDYAAIVLVDRRFAGQAARGKLSGWVRDGMRPDCEKGGVAELMGGLSGFFRGEKAEQD